MNIFKYKWSLANIMLLSMLLVGCNTPEEVDSFDSGDDVSDSTTSNPNSCSEGINPDLWSATDPLGRKMPNNDEVGAKNEKKLVAMFYWNWHCSFHVTNDTVGNVTQILKDYPEAINDADHPAWYRGATGRTHHFWGEPLLGYYRSTDPWVLRKHVEMLADAGVDVVFMDYSNGTYTWEESLYTMLEVWDNARKDGVAVPKVSFILPFSPGAYLSSQGGDDILRALYDGVFSKNLYPELWFHYNGSSRPTLMANLSSYIKTAKTEKDKAVAKFFDYIPVIAGYQVGPTSYSSKEWSWLEVYPQHLFNNGTMMSVGVAQNSSVGRVFDGKQGAGAFNVEKAYDRTFMADETGKNGTWDTSEYAVTKGANFQQQWDRALSQNSLEVIFVTGYNEFIAAKWDADLYPNWGGDPFSFVDQYNDYCSRDIEPNNEWYDAEGNYQGDTYYYQLVQNVRKFKGVTEFVYASEAKTISIGEFDGWGNDVQPDYKHYRGNTVHRDHPGYANKYYRNTSGRNDLVRAKVAHDDSNLYFYVETDEAITSYTDENWMWLLIDIDRDKETGWEGYDYIVNYTKPSDSATAFLQKNVGNEWSWGEGSEIAYAVDDYMMELAIPRSLLSEIGSDALDFEFKWSDNILPEDTDKPLASHFYINGDSAPGARFNFVYSQSGASGYGTSSGQTEDLDSDSGTFSK